MTATRTLAHGDYVHAAGWAAFPYDRCTAEVFTVRGYATGCRIDADAAEQDAIERGHPLASTINIGGALVADRATQQQMAAERDRRRAASIALTDGDEVEIEGRRYRVRISPENRRRPEHSDPIHFIPA